MAILSLQFPELLKQTERVELMQELFSDLTERQFIRGVKTLILNHREIYPGTNVIALIRDYAMTDPQEFSPEEAWAFVIKLRKQRTLEIPALVKNAIEAVGQWACLVPGDDESIVRAHFLRMYKAFQQRKKNDLIMGEL